MVIKNYYAPRRMCIESRFILWGVVIDFGHVGLIVAGLFGGFIVGMPVGFESAPQDVPCQTQ